MSRSNKFTNFADVPERFAEALVEWDIQHPGRIVREGYWNDDALWLIVLDDVVNPTLDPDLSRWDFYDWYPQMREWREWRAFRHTTRWSNFSRPDQGLPKKMLDKK